MQECCSSLGGWADFGGQEWGLMGAHAALSCLLKFLHRDRDRAGMLNVRTRRGCMLRSIRQHSSSCKDKVRACSWPTLCSSGQAAAQLTCLAAQSCQQGSRWDRSGLEVCSRTGQGSTASWPVHLQLLAEGHPAHAVLLVLCSHYSGQAGGGVQPRTCLLQQGMPAAARDMGLTLHAFMTVMLCSDCVRERTASPLQQSGA